MTRLTNDQFGAAVGCDFTTASKYRHGERMPSGRKLARIWEEFNLDGNELLRAYSQGADTFAKYLRDKVFEPVEDDSSQDPTVSGA